jgi:fatty-acyl-CoA synthase
VSVGSSSLNSLHLADAFDAAVRRGPDRPLLITGARSLTYAEVDREAAALAAAMADAGLGPGARIASILPNRPEAVITLLAVARLGATLVPCNPALTPHELGHLLRQAQVSMVVAGSPIGGRDLLDWYQAVLPGLPELESVVAVGADDLWLEDRLHTWGDLVRRGRRLTAPAAPRDPAATLAILFTSGTTGKPKGVSLTHAALVGNARATAGVLHTGNADVALLAVPHFTVFGITVTIGALDAGAALAPLAHFSPADVVERMRALGVTLCHGVPTMFALLVRQSGFTKGALPALRSGLIAGSPVPQDLVRAVRAVCDVEIAYGMTEAGPAITLTRPTDGAEQRTATVGRPLEGVEVRLVEAGTGTAAELVVRSPFLMAGYDRMPAETRQAFTSDGFLRTGDLAELDRDGCVRIVGRRKEIIIRGGVTVAPRELEDVLRAHPAVGDVCVVGVPHDVLGEMTCACIVPTEGALVRGEEILAFARERLADYKVPDLVRVLDALPMTASGKVQRRELAQAVALELTA